MRMEINQFYLNEHDEQKHFFEKKKMNFHSAQIWNGFKELNSRPCFELAMKITIEDNFPFNSQTCVRKWISEKSGSSQGVGHLPELILRVLSYQKIYQNVLILSQYCEGQILTNNMTVVWCSQAGDLILNNQPEFPSR